MAEVKLTLRINGRSLALEIDDDTPLLWALRDHLKLTGTQYGCGRGQCGICTVYLDGKPALACQYVLTDIGTHSVTTIEGTLPVT